MIQNLLKQIPGFDTLESSSLDKIGSTFYRQAFSQGQVLEEQSRWIKCIGLLGSGSADHMIKTADGEKKIQSIGPAEFFGAAGFFISGHAMTTLVATRPGVYFFQDTWDFKTMIKDHPDIRMFFYQSALLSMRHLWRAANSTPGLSRLGGIFSDACIDDEFSPGIKHAKAYIDINYREPIGIDDLARQCNMSKWYFSRVFKSTMGISFTHYLNLRRVEAAKKLMSKSDMNMTDICFHVGFNDLSYFSKVFQKAEGVLPSRYRNHLKKRDAAVHSMPS